MTPAALEREKPLAKDKLYVTDAELIRLIGAPREKTRKMINALDAMPNSGFPKKNKMWGDRRHWPSVKAYFERMEQRRMASSSNQRGSHGRHAEV
ncbi:MAG TPA: hypothetical protein VFB45_15290 [Pseudolabrys sp.]|nr:hypothetical protein [Pseudolabrys sp.]